MTGLVEGNAWEAEIYQLETDDPVMGGAEGIDNLQAKQLASRTQYLLAQLLLRATLESPTFTGDPKAPTPAAADNDTSIATTAFVKTAIANLVASSPAALDTLNELAAALGNDANFAATMTAALALKAPLASPTFTGDPKAPTPASGDNDTSIATTAFVQDAISQALYQLDYKASVKVASTAAINLAAPGANIDGVAMVIGDRFLEKDNATAANRGIYIWNGAAVPATRALDADTGAEINSGAIILVEQGATNADTNWQVTNDGAVTIGVTGLTFQKVGASTVVTAASDPTFVDNSSSAASTSWIRGAMSAIAVAAGFSYSFTTNGFIKFPDWLGGIIFQWATGATDPANNTEVSQTVTFPLAFVTAAYFSSVSTQQASASGACDLFYQSSPPTLTNMVVQRNQTGSASSNGVTTAPKVFLIGK
ncbi:hypothetical protein C3Y98_05295 [Methylotenera oryzisoli]|uniref:Putative tail fiber protein gp53-like C-terminal domain-containing protein n=1 Tax=Methylotenera oryzisoli TaxID=2080758 RepID=A0A4Y9VSL8_9PROT|nr:hypothetical protein [Methylotenera oryzisoli]TFW71513.1 hypothetical protein C3Y98_05295 [Methylotenera oryzisoli]